MYFADAWKHLPSPLFISLIHILDGPSLAKPYGRLYLFKATERSCKGKGIWSPRIGVIPPVMLQASALAVYLNPADHVESNSLSFPRTAGPELRLNIL